MHYGEADFAINPSIPNIYAKEAYQQNTMGQRFKPNFNDILLINTHYSCLGKFKNTQVIKILPDKNLKRKLKQLV